MRPYIGVTGFMSASEVNTVAEYMDDRFRDLMVGVLASSKTLLGMPNKWPGRFPRIGAIAEIYGACPGMLNLIHYSTDEPETLTDQLEAFLAIGGPHLHGFQLNVFWPDPLALQSFRQRHPDICIVLQIGAKAMTHFDDSPDPIAGAVARYEDAVDGVLIDPSGGLGRPFKVEKARFLLRAMQWKTRAALGIAGGLSAGSPLYPVEDLLKEFPDLSIDAEGRLRTPQMEDALDLVKASAYVSHACSLFV